MTGIFFNISEYYFNRGVGPLNCVDCPPSIRPDYPRHTKRLIPISGLLKNGLQIKSGSSFANDAGI
jgi:hypothetical protein